MIAFLVTVKFILVVRTSGRDVAGPAIFKTKQAAHPDRNVFVYRAGMCFLLGDSELREQVNNAVRLDFQLPCQLVNSNFTHTFA